MKKLVAFGGRILRFIMAVLLRPLLIGFARGLRVRRSLWPRRSVLFAGQAYYNAWYLSRALRNRGWLADVLNWDGDPSSRGFYHGEDLKIVGADANSVSAIGFILKALWKYDVFHFSNAHGIQFGDGISRPLQQIFGDRFDIELLKLAGKPVVYSNNACYDGVLQSTFERWGPYNVCAICRHRNSPSICSDARNTLWGEFRNSVADFQCLLGGNRADFNLAPTIHEVPQFYCLDPDVWHPDLAIPEEHRLPQVGPGVVRLYHAVAGYEHRTDENGINIKCSHIYKPLMDRYREEGLSIDMIFVSGKSNLEVRYYMLQCDIYLDMLTFGFFGAGAREAMMLGKPVVCFLRPEWLEDARREIPEYVDELPVVSATPDTVYDVVRELILDVNKRQRIGRRSREFAVKWHSAEAGGKRFDEIYSSLLRCNSK